MTFRTIALLSSLLLLTACSAAPGTWGWYVIDPTTDNGWTNIRFLIRGFTSTIQISVLAAVASIIIGLLVALPAFAQTAGCACPTGSMSSSSAQSRFCRCCSGSSMACPL